MENKWLDTQHRGFTAYQAETQDQASQQLIRMIVGAGISRESVDAVMLDCKVNTDWIEHIETALPPIEKAVREGRQFIIRQGETVPIEKVKRVSKTSVEHLARHSELITKEAPSDADLIPEKLHMTENLGTYSVYENRFLYMLLCYVRDFVNLRYRKILELASSFSSDVKLEKTLQDTNRKIEFSLHFRESAQAGTAGSTDGVLRRMDTILQTLELLFRTDLMKEVSMAPVLKPPITRTNAMLYDPNFKVAFELYSYLSSYEGDGFQRVERYRRSGDLNARTREDLAALVAMTSYMSYRSAGMYDVLEERYLAEETRRKEENDRIRRQQIAQLKEKLGPLDEKTAAYILSIEKLLEEKDDTKAQLLAQKAVQEQLAQQLEVAKQREQQLGAQQRTLEQAVAQKEQQIRSLTHENQQEAARHQEAMRRQKAAAQQQMEAFEKEYQLLKEKYLLSAAMGRNTATSEDCSDQASFEALEAQFKALKAYYERQWKLVKKQIRKDLQKKK